jgi:hypothetical protein
MLASSVSDAFRNQSNPAALSRVKLTSRLIIGLSGSDLLSAHDTLLLEVNADKDTSNLIEYALQNAGISYTAESHLPLKIRVPSYHPVVALLLVVLEERISAISGKVTLPDGTIFELTQEGLRAMRQLLISKVSNTPVVNPSAIPPQGGNTILDVLREALKNPEATGKLVREVSGAIRGDPEVVLEETKQVSRFTIAIMSLMALVIAGATILGYYGKVGGDTVGIVYGTVIGSSFAFLYRYIASPDESG